MVAWAWAVLWALAVARAAQCAVSARLSHEGLYINLPYAPTLTLYADAAFVDNATLHIHPLRVRTAAEVAECVAPNATSIEACEVQDIQGTQASAYVRHLSASDRHPDGGIPIARLRHGAQRADPLTWLMDERLGNSLRSVVVTLRTPKHKRTWWLGHLSLAPERRGRWPIAAADTATRDGLVVRNAHNGSWDGRAVRISGTMQDPFLPRSRLQAYAQNSSWARGVTVRTRTGGAPVYLRSPVRGTVVWSAAYTYVRPPTSGPQATRNNELDWCVMVRDEWGMVYQVFGIERGTAQVRAGDRVQAGSVLGTAHRTQLSLMPWSHAPPADPPKRYEEQGFLPYPYRFRRLEVRVGRIPCETPGAPCFDPEKAWTYYHPQLALVPRDAPSRAPPFTEPRQVYFAPASRTPLLTPPLAFPRHAAAHPMPLSGEVEIFSPFQAFEETVGDVDDAYDPIALYALDWAAAPRTSHALCTAKDAYWRRAFEHSRLAPNTSLWAHYVPTLVVASAAGHALRAQLKSQFDEKERGLVYCATRTSLGHLSLQGAWNITAEPTRGEHRVAVRARDLYGNTACTETIVRLVDPTTPHPNPWVPRAWHAWVLQTTLVGLPAAAAALLTGIARGLWILL